MELTPRAVSLLALLALVPAAAFVVLGSELVAAVTAINVVLIAASLAVALSPHDPPADTVGYNYVKIFHTPGCRNPSRDYSRQYEDPDDPAPDGA